MIGTKGGPGGTLVSLRIQNIYVMQATDTNTNNVAKFILFNMFNPVSKATMLVAR